MKTQQVDLNKLEVPFSVLMKFMLKLVLASIPAIVILYLVLAWCYAIFEDALLEI